MQTLIKKRMWLAALLASLLGLGVLGTALAAEIAGGEVYRLEAGEVIEDDLYVGANEIYIDGTVQGDLIAAGGYIEINGTVTGDAMVAGAGINLNGEVQDDVRMAGAGLDISGMIGDDLFAAGGGGQGFVFPVQVDGRNIDQGVRLADSAQVGGDAMIAGGQGNIAGTIGGDLRAGMGNINLAAQVTDDARLYGGNIQVNETAQVAGDLRYTTNERITLPEGVAANVEYIPPTQEAQPSPAARFLGWLVRTVLILIGFVLLAWLILRFAPRLVTRPVDAIANQPVQAGLYGLLTAAVFIFIPLASLLLVALMILFWGWFPGIVLGLFLFGALALIWFLSPLITGLWLGRWINLTMGRAPNYLPMLLLGVLLLALLGRIPILGWLIYLISFLFALGGLVLARRSDDDGTLGATVESRQLHPAAPARVSEA